jgi:SAM-dependent methyltransferase
MKRQINIRKLFKYGLDRDIPKLLKPPLGPQLNLGPGDKKIIPNTFGVGMGGALMDQWWMGGQALPYDDESIAAIHMYQFIEHFDWPDIELILRECERVLKPGGVIYIACPHQVSSMAYQALDHKTFWNEEVWNWLFGNEYYSDHEKTPWLLEVHACFIMGVVIRNLNLFTQLVKKPTIEEQA